MFEFSAWAQELPTRTYKAHSVSIALQVRNDVIDKGNAVVMKKEEVSSTGLVFPHAQRCYWLDIGHWKRTDPGVGWATWGVPLNTSHLGDSSSRTKQTPRSTPGCGGAWLNRQSAPAQQGGKEVHHRSPAFPLSRRSTGVGMGESRSRSNWPCHVAGTCTGIW